MGISVNWANEEQTIVRWIFDGPWTWQDFLDAQTQSNALLATVDHRVDIVGNLINSPSLPANALSAYKGVLKRAAPNIGLIVLVGSSSFVKAMVRTFNSIFRGSAPGTNFAFANSEAEAFEVIAKDRQLI